MTRAAILVAVLLSPLGLASLAEDGPAGLAPGTVYSVTRVGSLETSFGVTGMPPTISKLIWDLRFVETVETVEKGRVAAAIRVVSKATSAERHPFTGQMLENRLCEPGTKVRVTFDAASETRVTDMDDRPVGATTQIAAAGPVVMVVWPDGPLTAGQSWSYRGREVTDRCRALKFQGGTLELRVAEVTRDTKLGLEVARIRGKVKTALQAGKYDEPADYEGDVEVDLATALGLPLRTRISGPLSASGSIPNGYGGQIPVTLTGTFTSEQTVTPGGRAAVSPGGEAGQAEAGERTPLMKLIVAGKSDEALALIRSGKAGDLDAGDGKGLTALGHAAVTGDVEVIRALLAAKAGVDVASRSGTSPLMQAALRDRVEAFRILLEAGADPQHVDAEGDTVLVDACLANSTEIARTLLERKVDPDRCAVGGFTPLIIASDRGNEIVVKLLIAAGANVNAKEKGGETPLTAATTKGHSVVVTILKEAGAKE